MKKQCDNCKYSNKTMIEDLTCTNDKSEYADEFVIVDNLCSEWEAVDE